MREGYSGLHGGGGNMFGYTAGCMSCVCDSRLSSDFVSTSSVFSCFDFFFLFSALHCHIFRHPKCFFSSSISLLLTFFLFNIFFRLDSNFFSWFQLVGFQLVQLPPSGKPWLFTQSFTHAQLFRPCFLIISHNWAILGH